MGVLSSIIAPLSILAILVLGSCANARAGSGARAELVPGPSLDYTCVIIRDEEDKAVGGNCFKR